MTKRENQSNRYEKDSLGTRMKGYELATRTHMPTRTPVILRLDGKAFHTYTRGMERPYDYALADAMQRTMQFLCENIADCRFGYTQSDEITLVLTNDSSENYSAWFSNQVQKMVSIASSLCTFKFNQIMYERTGTMALFDCRAFTVPDYVEAANCLYWRQLDAKRNSVQMLSQSLYSSNQLHGLSCAVLEEKIEAEHGIIWKELETWKKWGTTCIKTPEGWEIDYEVKLFKDDWDYVYSRLNTAV